MIFGVPDMNAGICGNGRTETESGMHSFVCIQMQMRASQFTNAARKSDIN